MFRRFLKGVLEVGFIFPALPPSEALHDLNLKTIFRDVFKGNLFPTIPVSEQIRDLSFFWERIGNNEAGVKSSLLAGGALENEPLPVSFQLTKEFSPLDRVYLPMYTFSGTLRQREEIILIEGKFGPPDNSNNVFQVLAWAFLSIFLATLVIDILLFLKFGLFGDDKLLLFSLLLVVGWVLIFLFLTVMANIYKRIELKRVTKIRNVIEAATY